MAAFVLCCLKMSSSVKDTGGRKVGQHLLHLVVVCQVRAVVSQPKVGGGSWAPQADKGPVIVAGSRLLDGE